MEMMEPKEAIVEVEPASITLRANGDQLKEKKVTWEELREASIGTRWEVIASGYAHTEQHSALLVFRDDTCATVLITHKRKQHNNPEQLRHELRVFVFAKGHE